MTSIKRITLPVVLLSLIQSSVGLASTICWDGGGGDDLWLNAANWDGDTLPTSTDDVEIGVGPAPCLTGTYTVKIINGGVTIASIHSGADQTIVITHGYSPAFFVVNGSATIDGPITLGGTTACTLNFNGVTTLNGTVTHNKRGVRGNGDGDGKRPV